MKPILYLDFDGTLVNTIKQIVRMYNYDFGYHSNYKYVDWRDINSWDFVECICASKQQINAYFNQPRFFEQVEWMHLAEGILLELSKHYTLKIVTMGNDANFLGKEEWRNNQRIPFSEIIAIDMNAYEDKSHIDMSGAAFVDDSSKNLITSNAELKICFGKEYPWNQDWNGIRVNNWVECGNELLRFVKGLNE